MKVEMLCWSTTEEMYELGPTVDLERVPCIGETVITDDDEFWTVRDVLTSIDGDPITIQLGKGES